ncbi:MAG: ketoacyl-ACP synthase III [Actinobacteria bacterium]|nr:ketoacyl-ACP synthase III [Actinomycetota bacterium]
MVNIATPAVATHAGLLGLGAYRPQRVVPNSELVARIDSSDEWIRERSGIVERRYAAADETVSSMAAAAAVAALEDAKLSPTEIDLVILATFTHRYATPSAAAEVSALIGAENAAAVDVGAACAGFAYALGMADAAVRAGTAKKVLVIGAEKISEVIDFDDRGTAFLFGDGAGAAVVGATEAQGIGPTVWGADGSQMDAIIMNPDVFTAGRDKTNSVLTMQGQKVFRWAISSMGDVCQRALAAAQVTADDIAAFVPHQANLRITSALVKSLGFPESVVIAKDIESAGNTSAASIPLALDRLRKDGQLNSGDLVLLVGFGAGLAYAAQVARIP